MLRLPDGATLLLATAYEAAKAMTALSNANPAVAAINANGYANGDFLEVTSGWNKINGSIRRAAGAAANAVNIDGLDATDVNQYPAGGGTGTVRKITTFTQIQQIIGVSTNGGEQQFATAKLLENNFETQLPTFFSAQSLEITIADDPALTGYIALKAASDSGATRALKLQLKDGSFLLYNGIVSLNETPSLNSGEVMTVTATFALQGRPVRYAS